jgi:hypothetical protein
MSSLEKFQNYVDEIRSASPIEEVARRYVGDTMQQRGDRLVCCSPFRDEKEPSLFLFPSQGTWWDFGSQEGSDCFDLVQKCENVSFKESVAILARVAGLDPWSERSNGASAKETDSELEDICERRWVGSVQNQAALYYHSRLTPKAREFLKENYGFTDDTISLESIGWCDGTFVEHLAGAIPPERLLATGMFRPSRTGDRLFEVHEGRLTFPYHQKGIAAYMISRRVPNLTPDTEWQKQKYKKSLVHSERNPYVSKFVCNDIFNGEDSLSRGPKKVCIVTEGTTDRITATQCGYAAISPGTTSIKTSDVARARVLLSKFQHPVIINDEEEPKVNNATGESQRPGFDGALKTAKALFFAGLTNIRVGRLPRNDGAAKIDIASFVQEMGAPALKKVVKGAKTYPRVLLDEIPEDTDPAELDIHLFPIYEALALLPARARDGYVTMICKRLGITKKVVRDDIAGFLKESSETPGSSSGPPSVPPPAAAGSPPSSTGGIPKIRGHIFESPDGYYFTYSKDGIIERISNFVVTPTRSVSLDGEDRLGVNIRMVDGRSFNNKLLPTTAFHSERELVRAVQTVSKRLAWSGTNANVHGLVEHLRGHEVPEFTGVPSLGYVETADGPRWVLSDAVFSADGLDPDTKLTYAPPTVPPLSCRLDYATAEFDPSLASPLAANVLPRLFELNRPEVIIPLLGWFYASSIAPAIRRIAGYFPVMFVWGTQGSSKTSTSRDIFWRLLGVKGEPFSCSDTPFAMLINAAASSSIPVVMDEFKSDLPKNTYERVCRLARKAYGGEDESRGRADLKINVYKNSSPLCIVGEQMPTQPALRERMLVASPLKPSLTRERRRVFSEVTRSDLTSLAGPWLRFVLSVDVEAAWADAQAVIRSMLNVGRIAPRIRDNLTVMVLGNALFDSWARSLGVDLPCRPLVRDHIQAILTSITESDGSGLVKTAADSFLESISTYARLGKLEEGREYALVNGELCLHLRSCYEVYLQERKRSGQGDDTNGYAALRRAFSEGREPGGYVTHLDKRVTMPRSGSFIRALTIDMSLLPPELDVHFQGSVQRQWGGERSFHDAETN